MSCLMFTLLLKQKNRTSIYLKYSNYKESNRLNFSRWRTFTSLICGKSHWKTHGARSCWSFDKFSSKALVAYCTSFFTAWLPNSNVVHNNQQLHYHGQVEDKRTSLSDNEYTLQYMQQRRNMLIMKEHIKPSNTIFHKRSSSNKLEYINKKYRHSKGKLRIFSLHTIIKVFQWKRIKKTKNLAVLTQSQQ